jgi:hypothetical protein
MPYPSSIKAFINPISRTNLVCYLDAGNPSSYPGSGTTWFDLTGRGNNCSLTNGAYYDTEGQGSIYFDGTNDLGVIAAASDLDFPADFTVESWFHWIPFRGSSLDGGAGWYGLGIFHRRWSPDTGTWALASFGQNDLFWRQFNPSVNVFGDVGYHVRNRWTHVVVTRSSGTMRIYQDGVLLATASNSVNYTIDNASGYWLINSNSTITNTNTNSVSVSSLSRGAPITITASYNVQNTDNWIIITLFV